jgi:hypothetical protein
MQSTLIGAREHFLIVEILIKCWPSLSPLKQASFFKFLTFLISSVEPKLSHARSARLIKIIADGAISPNASVASAAISLLMDNGIDAFVADHSRTLFPVLYPAFAEASQAHWMAEVREAAKRALSFFSRMDPQMYREVSRSEPETDEKPGAKAKAWSAICKQAGERDRTINTRGKVSEILRAFAMSKTAPASAPAGPIVGMLGRKSARDPSKSDPAAELQQNRRGPAEFRRPR